ncbi:MAG: ribosomal protein S18-alanine N-acetyltransferase [Oscillospiraceae bacterium]|jgi:ribosomal-protein-alanine acetyltransferase|nr:ribosomal protein S18-alanine N-acetyltransferase [Oscillospiraceae bacterium]
MPRSCRILFICTGNTCRSPLAAAGFAALCKKAGLENVEAASAGLSAQSASPAAAHMQHAAQEEGLDLTLHRSRQADAALLNAADLVVCLSTSHALLLAALVPHEKIRVLGGGISDPFGSSLACYRACAKEILKALPALLRELAAPFSFLEPACRIVPAKTVHLPELAALEAQCFSTPWSAQSLASSLDAANNRFLAAFWGERLVGYLGLTQVMEQADILNIATAPDFRRHGIANALLARAETQSILAGCGELRLEVRESNEAARALYAARGYMQTGRRRQYYQAPQEDALLLTLHCY